MTCKKATGFQLANNENKTSYELPIESFEPEIPKLRRWPPPPAIIKRDAEITRIFFDTLEV